MTTVIIGGGFLARYVAAALCERGDEVVVFTRGEANACTLRDFVNDPKCRVVIRDLFDLTPEDVGDCSQIVHTAAMKHIDLCAAHPENAMRQNIAGTEAILALAKRTHSRVVHISTDKACCPTTFYGATKMIAERLALRAGASVVRLPNLFGSTGSVIPRWVETIKSRGEVPVTSREMLRYFCHPKSAARTVLALLDDPKPGRIVVPESYEVAIARLADLVGQRTGMDYKLVEIGLRGGEKLREVLAVDSENAIIEARGVTALEELMMWRWVQEFVPQMSTKNIAQHPVYPPG